MVNKMVVYYGLKSGMLYFTVYLKNVLLLTRVKKYEGKGLEDIDSIYENLGVCMESLQSTCLNKNIDVPESGIIIVHNIRHLTTDLHSISVKKDRRFAFNLLMNTLESLVYPVGLIESKGLDFKFKDVQEDYMALNW